MAPSTPPSRATLKLSIVVPVYRSQACLAELVDAINRTMAKTGWTYETIFVNDFSPDRSWDIIAELASQDPRVVGIDLRRNFGQDNAILTGMRFARGQFVVIMDDDLQHHPKYIPALLEKLEEGADVVYAKFNLKRQKWWKNLGSWINGRIAESLIYKPRDVYLSPFKIVRKEVADAVCSHSGPWPYIDGLLYQYTWRIASIPVEHLERFAGDSNYTFWRSLGISARLVFSFSIKPVRLVTWTGFAAAALGLTAAVGIMGYRLLVPRDFAPQAVGWASLMVTFLFLGGMQMMIFGILGEYIGRTYLRLDNKPQTSIREVLNRNTGSELACSLPESLHEVSDSCRPA
jgi:undecaprenyl-phosphate 4-deoxy-4-formamido-L-arabinose transferase